MARIIKITATSVRQRLFNNAKNTNRPFNELLHHFAIERFIYWLSKSPHADRFLLKGSLGGSIFSCHFETFLDPFIRDANYLSWPAPQPPNPRSSPFLAVYDRFG
jgi:hypothetical protein